MRSFGCPFQTVSLFDLSHSRLTDLLKYPEAISRIMTRSKSNISESCSVYIFRVDVVKNRQSTHFSVLPSMPVLHWPANLQHGSNERRTEYIHRLSALHNRCTPRSDLSHTRSQMLSTVIYTNRLLSVINKY